MSDSMPIKWACPKCGAEANKHGKGGQKKCDYSSDAECNGFLCECADDHAEHSFANPCENANCYHCGWGGTFPVKPKGLQAWEKKALEAGWTPPGARRKELGL